MSTVAARPPAYAVRKRVRAWLTSRLPRTDTQLLTQGNVYILPTRAGWMFALTLIVLLLASVNYQLNLGYILTFLLAGSGIVSMHVTHGTLRGLTLHLRPVAPAFAGSPAVLDVVMSSPSSPRFGVGLRLLDAAPATLAWTTRAEVDPLPASSIPANAITAAANRAAPARAGRASVGISNDGRRRGRGRVWGAPIGSARTPSITRRLSARGTWTEGAVIASASTTACRLVTSSRQTAHRAMWARNASSSWSSSAPTTYAAASPPHRSTELTPPPPPDRPNAAASSTNPTASCPSQSPRATPTSPQSANA